MKKKTNRLRPEAPAARTVANDDVTLPLVTFSRKGPGSKADTLLRAALVAFLEFGAYGATPERISSIAGISLNTFYRALGSKAGCFDTLFDECWHELNQAIKDRDYIPDFAFEHTPERLLLRDVEFILTQYRDRSGPLRDVISYLMTTISRPLHLSDPNYAPPSQGLFEDRLFALSAAVIDQNDLSNVEPFDVANHVFTFVRTTVATWDTPQGERVLDQHRVLDEVAHYLRGEDGGSDGPDSRGTHCDGSPVAAEPSLATT